MSTLLCAIHGAIRAANTISFNSGTGRFSAVGADWSFESALSSVESTISEEDRLALEFYSSLPIDLRAAVSVHDFEATTDGFVLCTKPLDVILEKMSCEAGDVEGFQDFYLWGIKDPSGGFVHSMMEVVLPGSDTPSCISLPFRSFDVSAFEEVGPKNLTQLDDARIGLLTSANSDNPDFRLINYFRNPKSKGSYLIADIAIAQALGNAGITGKGTWEPGNIAQVMDTCPYTASALKKLQEKEVVDIDSGKVFIKDARNLSSDEKAAVLACITSNPDVYSFAAENQFHAEAFALGYAAAAVPEVKPVPYDAPYTSPSHALPDFLGAVTGFMRENGPKLQRHAVVSDAGVGERVSFPDYRFLFKERPAGPDETNYYSQQIDAHR